jgi:hypothetical protein
LFDRRKKKRSQTKKQNKVVNTTTIAPIPSGMGQRPQ